MLRRLLPLAVPVLLLACATLSSATPTEGISTQVPELILPSPTLPPAPTIPPIATSIPGWLTYHNSMMGFSFDYPPTAVLTTSGVSGFPSEELPAGIAPGEYIATLEVTYTEALCAGLQLPAAYFIIWPPQDKGGRYAGPCGVTGFGAFDLRKDQEAITVDGESTTLQTIRAFLRGTDTLVDEVSTVRLADGTLLTLASAWEDAGLTYDDFLADRAVILQVIASYRSNP